VFKRGDSEPGRDGKESAAAGSAQPKVLRPSLGADTSVTGKLSFEGPTRIDGKLRGEVRAGDLLVIGETGVVEGVVRAKRLIVHGQIHGEVRGAEHVEITATGVVTGLVEANSLLVHDGATLRADLKLEPPRAATVHVLRRPTNADGMAD
jgi:cytoskeletal protein CcmA (bactofilin family)